MNKKTTAKEVERFYRLLLKVSVEKFVNVFEVCQKAIHAKIGEIIILKPT